MGGPSAAGNHCAFRVDRTDGWSPVRRRKAADDRIPLMRQLTVTCGARQPSAANRSPVLGVPSVGL
jgi:hypothetical protein